MIFGSCSSIQTSNIIVLTSSLKKNHPEISYRLIQATWRQRNVAHAGMRGNHGTPRAFMFNRSVFEMRKSKPEWLKDRSTRNTGSGLPNWPSQPAWSCQSDDLLYN